MVAVMVGVLASGPAADAVGRRACLAVSNAVVLFGWALTAAATDFPVMMASRIVGAVGCGTIWSTAYLMLSEISLIRCVEVHFS